MYEENNNTIRSKEMLPGIDNSGNNSLATGSIRTLCLANPLHGHVEVLTSPSRSDGRVLREINLVAAGCRTCVLCHILSNMHSHPTSMIMHIYPHLAA